MAAHADPSLPWPSSRVWPAISGPLGERGGVSGEEERTSAAIKGPSAAVAVLPSAANSPLPPPATSSPATARHFCVCRGFPELPPPRICWGQSKGPFAVPSAIRPFIILLSFSFAHILNSLSSSSSSSFHHQRSSSSPNASRVQSSKMRVLQILFLLLVPLLMVVTASPLFDTDMAQPRMYRALWLNPKRSPSIGLSLAEYMAAGNQGADQFHFIPSRK